MQQNQSNLSHRKAFKDTLQARLLATILILTLIPLAVLGVFSYDRSQQAVTASETTDLQASNQMTKQVVENWLSNVTNDTILIAGLEANNVNNVPQISTDLYNFDKTWGTYEFDHVCRPGWENSGQYRGRQCYRRL